MKHLNYCRQMVKQFSRSISSPDFPEINRTILSNAINLAKKSQKFLLPEGGRLYDDPEYRALDETEILHLPYPVIALEYSRADVPVKDDQSKCSKAIVFAREDKEYIILTAIVWSDSHKMWAPFPELLIPRVNYLDRSNVRNGRVAIKATARRSAVGWLSELCDEMGALLCFLNVLQCKNVRAERSEPKKIHQFIKSAIPFDDYHILTIDSPNTENCRQATKGTHRSPREHLRRGHIRRLSDGRKVWVNATVVAAGRSCGVIKKEYALA
jgi:hypothetical protein